MSNIKSNETFSSQDKEVSPVDIKRILYQSVRYWYFIALSILLFLTTAFLINRYSSRIYAVNASIIIRESEEGTGGELLYNNPIVKFNRNYFNEPYIIKSKPLVERVVIEQGFDKTLYKVGNFKNSESYRTSVLRVDVINNPTNKPFTFTISVKNEKSFTLSYRLDDEEINEEHTFEEVINQQDIQYKIYRSENVQAGDVFIYSQARPIDIASSYIGRLQVVWAEEGAAVINLSLTGATPQKEVDFLSALIANYQEYDLEKKNLTASNTIHFIEGQLKSISDSLIQAERQLQLFKDRNIMTDLNAEALRLYEKMENLELQKTDLVIRESYYTYLSDYIKNSAELEQIILPSSVGITDNILSELVSSMIATQGEIKMLNRSEKLQSPFLADKLKKLQQIRENITEAVKNQKSVDKIKLDFLKKGIAEIDKQLNYLPGAERQLVNIKRNYALLENLYIFLLQKRAEAGISKASNTSDIAVVNPPAVGAIISPNGSRNYVLALSLGTTLPFLIIILLDLFNGRVQSREEMEKLTSIPFIGGVGHKDSELNLQVFNKPKSAISESFRALRSNLNFFLKGKESGVFLITSSISGEGKTFTSINLASVFSLSGKKTLIVGADMRKPKIFGDFKLDNSKGLSNYLAGLSGFQDIIQKTSYANLDLVTGGPVPPNPSELILDPRMQTFIEEAKKHYDYVFIDSPPLALVTDAFVLSSMVDHTLFIVRQNYTPKALLSTINDYYKEGKISHMSLVLNDIYKSGPGYGYGYGYAYGYGYGYGYGFAKRKNGLGYYEE